MNDDARFIDQAAIHFASQFSSDPKRKVIYKGKEYKDEEKLCADAYNLAEMLAAERSARKPQEGIFLTGVELASLREALIHFDDGDNVKTGASFADYFHKAMTKRDVAKVGVNVALRKIYGVTE